MLLKLESLNLCYKEAFLNFLNIKVDKLIMTNESSKKKDFNALYSHLKNQILFTKPELEKVYNSKYDFSEFFADYFYSTNKLPVDRFLSDSEPDPPSESEPDPQQSGGGGCFINYLNHAN